MVVMRAVVVVVLACGLVCALANCAASGPSAFKESEKQPFADAHNAVRASALPAPQPALPELQWSEDVASVAQAWSARCVFEHSHGSLGENIAYFSGSASTPNDVVDEWASEIADYDYATNTCAAGKQCGHYTQIIWRNTAKVGCGASACNMFGADGVFWVCNYDPPGNFVGEKPY